MATRDVAPLLAGERDARQIPGAIHSFAGSSPLDDPQHICRQLERSRTLLHSIGSDYTVEQHIGAVPCCLGTDTRTRTATYRG
jgi:hypothetical protein